MNTQENTLHTLVQNDARQDEQLRFLEKRDTEYREMISCMHRMNANVEGLTQRVKENNDIIKEHIAQQTTQNDELRKYVDETIKDLRVEIDDRFKTHDDRFKTHGERIGLISKESGEKAKKSWETVKYAAITAIVTAIITAVVSYFIYVS